jgi:molecular chaperone DnaK
MTITGQSSLSKDQIEPDGQGRRGPRRGGPPREGGAEVRNKADTLVYQTEKLLKEQGDKVSGSEKDTEVIDDEDSQ